MARFVELVLRLAFAGVYAWAASGKLEDPYAFARAIHNYRLLPDAWIVPFALVLPPLEILAAVGILLGFPFRGSTVVLGGLSLVFAVAVGSAVVRGIDLSCGCFGTHAEGRADWLHVAGNLAGAAAAVWLLSRPAAGGRLRPLWSRRPRQ